MRRSIAAMLSITLLPVTAAYGSYTFNLLSSPGGSLTLLGNLGLNSGGQASGIAEFKPSSLNAPTIWTHGQPQVLNISTLGVATAPGINDSGQVVGMIENASHNLHAYSYDGSFRTLYGINGAESTAYGINNQGQVAGASKVENGTTSRAVVWTHNTPQLLGVNALFSSFAWAINNNGDVVGQYLGDPGSFTTGSFTWSHGKTTYLPGLGGPNWIASAINNSGVALGNAEDFSGHFHPVEWDASGAIHVLGTLPEGGDFNAVAINDCGQVVGTDALSATVRDAVVYQNGRLEDLNTLVPVNLGYHLYETFNINNSGQILAAGESVGREPALFLLSPDLVANPINQIAAVPEPASGMTILSVGNALLFRRRRSR